MFTMFLLSFLLPVLAGAGILALGWLLPPVRKIAWLSGCAFGVALAGGLALSYLAESGFPSYPPVRSEGWIMLAALACIPFAFFLSFTEKLEFPWIELTALGTGVFVGLLPVISGSELVAGIPKPLFPEMGIVSHATLALELAFGILIVIRLAQVRVGATLPTVFAICFTGASACSMASGWISLSIMFGVLAAVSGAAALFARFSGSPNIGRAGAVVSVGLLIFLSTACWYKTTAPSEVTWWVWILLVGAPVLLLPLENRFINKLPPAGGYWIRVIVVAIPVVWVLIRIYPAVAGEASNAPDEMDEMMKMYQ
ncbi:MAG: hypothetical protein CBC35_02535 [Planctomycetes bacterium TMED75]|nr:hypothetical protein [Planctomycetaceae bacterium]OUU95741.1 MAG: hypothetical protein CBC35_02535 [Planctomycetes bacterium TMED75]